jgi:hypothetical protein
VNDRYLDRNYGGILIIWDRLFGTFIEEDDAEPIVYGTRKPLRSLDPLWANVEVYAALLSDSWHAASWSDKLRVWLKPPAWRPADVAARWPGPAFDLGRAPFKPPLSGLRAVLAIALFTALLLATAALLWRAEQLGVPQKGMGAVAIVFGLWCMGRIGASPRV